MDESKAREAFDTALDTYRQEFGHFFLARFYGMDIRYEGNESVVEFDVQEYMFNPQGSLHGGVMATVMDISMGHLLKHVSGPGATLEIKVQYIRPVRVGRVQVRGSFVRQGKSISFMRSEASDAEGNLLAFATATWKLL